MSEDARIYPFPDSEGSEDEAADALADEAEQDSARAWVRPQVQDTHDDADDEGLGEDEDVDAESVLVDRPAPGRPVDPPDEPGAPAPARVRAPVVPLWLRSRASVRAAVRRWLADVRYWCAYHAIRSPKYAGKVAVYAPVGIVRGTGRLTRWASAETHNWDLRQRSAARNDPETWMRLDMRRQRQSRWRWTVVAVAVPLTAAVGIVGLVVTPAPLLVRPLALLAAALGAARLGRPADRPITDRVSTGPTYRKLTAELVRRALLATQIQAMTSAVAKDPGAISFPSEIHRDGPGHLAIIDLPYGVEAADVIARRGRLASGMRLPLDQVWPEPARADHPGRLALWVGYQPASAMKQPTWPLIREGQVDVFKPFPFATTPRGDTVLAELMYRNWLFGGQPGSGKTFALRDLVLAAALDPRVEIRGYELKGVGDFREVEPVCKEYGNGFDDETLAACAEMWSWLYGECQRRSKRIAHYAALGKAPENKVTPELASLPGSGLHPLVIFVDEIQELFLHPKFSKQVGEIPEKVIKLGRALGTILLLGTQIPDKDSLPPGITRNINTRFCLSVADQVANDMILGTSAYKLGHRATVFEPVTEAGWGILAGLGRTAPRRSFYVDNRAASTVMTRAIALRTAAGTMPEPGTQTRQTTPGVDILADLATVIPAGEDKVWSETVIPRLAAHRADYDQYRQWAAALADGDPQRATWAVTQLAAALRPFGVRTVQISRREGGEQINRRGFTRADITTAITERDRKTGGN